MFKQLKGSWFGQILRFNTTSNNLERYLIPVANENEINVAERNKMKFVIWSFKWMQVFCGHVRKFLSNEPWRYMDLARVWRWSLQNKDV